MRFFFTFIPPTEFAEDAPHTSSDKGVQALAVQKATPADISSEGDYSPQQVSGGRTWTSTKIDTALPAGTNAIGKLAANDGVDIGDVTVNNASGASAVNIQDGGNSITVDGSVTVTQATGTNLHTVIDSGTTTVTQATGTNLHTVVDSGVITTVGAITSITNALPTGTNSIGDIRSITTSVTPGTAATNLGKAEDAPHTTGDVGVMTLGVRNDTGVALANSDQDYVPHTMNSQGGMWVAPINFPSTANSTTATLAASAVFTGTAEACSNFASIVVSVYADQPSAINGLSVQQSSDGTNWDIFDTYTIPAFNGKTYSFQPASSFYRIVYTNGATAQTAFRLKTVLHSVYTKPSSQKAMDMYTSETDLEQAQAFGMTYDPNQNNWNMERGDTVNGTWVNVKQMPPGFSTDALLEQLILLNTPTVNWTRQLDPSGREKIAPPSDTFTYNTTITASTAETTILPAMGVKTVLVGLVIANTSASTFTEITIRDSTGATDATSLQTFTSLGGAPHSGFMLGTQRIPQKVGNNNWTAQCGTSTTSIKITVYYQIV